MKNKFSIKSVISYFYLLLMVLIFTSSVSAINFSILKNDADATVRYGETITYDIEFSNYENRDLINVIIEDTIPIGTTFIATENWSCDGYTTGEVVPEGVLCTYEIGTIPFGTYNYTVANIMTVNVLENTYLPSITNWMYVSENNGTDLLATSNVTTPIWLPEIYASIYANSDTFDCFSTVHYTISVDNYLDKDIDNVVLQFVRPDELISQSPEWNCDTDNLCEYYYGSLLAHTSDNISFNATNVDASVCTNNPITIDLDVPNVDNINEYYAYSTVNFSPITSTDLTVDINKELYDLQTLIEGEEYLATIKITITNNTLSNFIGIDALEDLTLLNAFDDYEFLSLHTVGCDANPDFDGDLQKNMLTFQTFSTLQTCEIYYNIKLFESTNALYNITTDILLYYDFDSVLWDTVELQFDLEGYIYSPPSLVQGDGLINILGADDVKQKINNKYKQKKENLHNIKNLIKKK